MLLANCTRHWDGPSSEALVDLVEFGFIREQVFFATTDVVMNRDYLLLRDKFGPSAEIELIHSKVLSLLK